MKNAEIITTVTPDDKIKYKCVLKVTDLEIEEIHKSLPEILKELDYKIDDNQLILYHIIQYKSRDELERNIDSDEHDFIRKVQDNLNNLFPDEEVNILQTT